MVLLSCLSNGFHPGLERGRLPQCLSCVCASTASPPLFSGERVVLSQDGWLKILHVTAIPNKHLWTRQTSCKLMSASTLGVSMP